MKILVFSSLFPNSRQPTHAIFVENRLRHLLRTGEVEAQVVAPVPWFPFKASVFGTYAKYAGVLPREERHGVVVHHPRHKVVPKIGMNWTPGSLARAGAKCARRIRDEGFDFDLIDAHYFYPDGVAAVRVGEALGVPVVVTARGSDINVLATHPKPRGMIVDAADRAAANITVCQALKDSMVQLGCDGQKITVLRNGVDLGFFRPAEDRDALRGDLGYTRRTVISVGNLQAHKGHDLVIEAVRGLPDVDLSLIGSGEDQKALADQARAAGVEDRVRFFGRIDQQSLLRHYQAADALVLASSREGWANVLLEALACGTRVVATRVGGTPEVVQGVAAGVLVDRDSESIARGLAGLFDDSVARDETRAYAESFSWEATSSGQLALFRDVLQKTRQRAAT